MARTRKYNENMGELKEAITRYMGEQAEVRHHYARLAEEELEKRRQRVLDLMFVVHADAGPSEIANSTGISRSTVVRWRDEFLQAQKAKVAARVEPEVVADDAEDSELRWNYRSDKYDGTPTAYLEVWEGDEQYRLWILTGEDFGIGYTPQEADGNHVERPEWLTDEVLREAVDATGVRLLLAPWNN